MPRKRQYTTTRRDGRDPERLKSWYEKFGGRSAYNRMNRDKKLRECADNSDNNKCKFCPHRQQCNEIITTGQLLPCQPQAQKPILNMRHLGDNVVYLPESIGRSGDETWER